MKIDRSAQLIYSPRTPGAVINGVTIDTIDGTAHSGHGIACVGYEAGATPLTSVATRKGGSRAYVRLTVNRGDLKVIPVTGKSGDVIGIEFAASGDDAGVALAAAIAKIAETLRDNL